ncbi:hypothetical protein DOL88_04215 [Aggregatibacter aphrophilus]|uniref:Uncharacterized protein n=1 Tax=Aggregatibacter aphrophilus TaxID=732 RepID=A0ABX9VVH2_AGGAP|nr:hypothetical protein DOL88_04215 [Aggregatibacter aphrophilus]
MPIRSMGVRTVLEQVLLLVLPVRMLPHGRMLKEGNLLLSAQIQMQAVLNLLLSGMMFLHQGEVQ